jgi:acyl-CoA synthetase (AMP-forming)/AMP-acid ligase II
MERIAAALPRSKCMIVVLVRTDVPSLLSYLGALAGGHAVLPLNADLDSGFLQRLVTQYQPEVILAPNDALSLADLSKTGAYSAHDRLMPETQIWNHRGGQQPTVNPALTLLLSTSGSTGNPKLVRLSERNVVSNADSIRVALGIDQHERACTSLAFSYSYGLSVVHSHLRAGGCVVVTRPTLVKREFWDELRQNRCTSLAGVPYMFEMLRRVGFERMELPHLRTLTQAGGKLGNEMILQFHRWMSARNGNLTVMYGQTEATARIACLPPELLPQKVGSVGYAIPGGKIRIVGDDTDTPLPPGGTGEIEYTGPNVMMGYASTREDLARGDELGGVLRTGDVGYLDEDGCLFVTGRRRRFAKLVGFRVSLDDVEGQLQGAGSVAAVDGGESIIVFCTPDSEGAVRESLKDLSARLHVPASSLRLRVIDSFPLLSNGKIDYQQLGQQLDSSGN